MEMVQNTKVHHYSGKKEANYKAKSKFEKKFLGVPGTSGPVERGFQSGWMNS